MGARLIEIAVFLILAAFFIGYVLDITKKK